MPADCPVPSVLGYALEFGFWLLDLVLRTLQPHRYRDSQREQEHHLPWLDLPISEPFSERLFGAVSQIVNLLWIWFSRRLTNPTNCFDRNHTDAGCIADAC